MNIGICTKNYIFGTYKRNIGQNAPHHKLDKLPPLKEKVETIDILRQNNNAQKPNKKYKKYETNTLH